MEWWQLAAAASESASDQCVPHTWQVAWLGPQVLDVRFGCEVCLVVGPDYQHPCINWIGVATVVRVASDLLLYFFVRSFVNN